MFNCNNMAFKMRKSLIISLTSLIILSCLYIFYVKNPLHITTYEIVEKNPDNFAYGIEPAQKITWDQKNLITGWAFSKISDNPVDVKIMLDDELIATHKADVARQDVAAEFPSFSQAKLAGFEFLLKMNNLPRKNGFLKIVLQDDKQNIKIIKGAYLDNDAPIGKVVSSSQYIDMSNKDDVTLKIWAFDETGIKSVQIKIGDLIVATPENFVKTTLPIDLNYTNSQQNHGKYTKILGQLYEVTIPKKDIASGVSRVNVVIEDNENKTSIIAGSLLINEGKNIADAKSASNSPCKKSKIINIYYPVDLPRIKQIEKLQAIKKIFTSPCVKLGLRTRIEYLRSTTGKINNYMFDPDFSQNIIINDVQKTTTGVPLSLALATAKQLDMPILLTLDGGV